MELYFAALDIGTPQLLLLLAIVLLLFGGKKLPELSKSIGESMKELRKGMDNGENKTAKKTDDNKTQGL